MIGIVQTEIGVSNGLYIVGQNTSAVKFRRRQSEMHKAAVATEKISARCRVKQWLHLK